MNFYIHIPFCRQKCPYCKFALTPIFDAVKKRRYIAHLKKEILRFFESREKINIDTLYFGGGTPSVLSIEEVSDILSSFSPGEASSREVTFECNPEDITSEYIGNLMDIGINRLSIGVQSLNNTTLKAIHRSDRESIFRALDAIKNNTLSKNISINIDFILGLPFSEPGETLANIRELHSTYPLITHTSVYMLEDGLYPKEWKQYSLSEIEMEREYREICEYFDSLGWHHYEVSSWAQSGYECRHNLGYWDHTNTRGFGLGATSYIDRHRFTNSESFSGYYRGEEASHEVVTDDSYTLEKMIYDLRTFRLEMSIGQEDILTSLVREGYISIKNKKIILTPAGIFRENFILKELSYIL